MKFSEKARTQNTYNDLSASGREVLEEISLSFPTMLLHSALLLDVLILLYLNFYLKQETLAPFFLLTPWLTARWARNYFIKTNKRNLTSSEKRILCANSMRAWSLLCYGLRFWFAVTYLGWEEILVCILVFAVTYPFGRFLHLGLLRWGFRDVSDEHLAYMLDLPALPKEYITRRENAARSRT